MKNIVIIVDMQNGFARQEQIKKLAKKIKKLLEAKVFDKIIATRFINYDNSIYEQLFDWKKLKSVEEIEIVDELAEYIDEIIDKAVYTCINSSFIKRLCQLNDGKYPEKIFIVGADTDCCVLSIATGLFEHNIRPIVLSAYCNSNGGLESHNAGLLCLKRLIGAKQLINIEIKDKIDLLDI